MNKPKEMGVAMIEFVIVLLPLLLIFFGIIDFGRVMQLDTQVVTAAEAGSLYAYQTWQRGEGNIATNTTRKNAIAQRAACGVSSKSNSTCSTVVLSSNVVVRKECCCASGYSPVPSGAITSNCTESNCATADSTSSSVMCSNGSVSIPPRIIYYVTAQGTFVPVTGLIGNIVGNQMILSKTSEIRVQ